MRAMLTRVAGGHGEEARGLRAGSRGFTLAELITVLAILALIGGLGAGAYQSLRRSYAFTSEVARLEGVLLRARNAAIESRSPSLVSIDPLKGTMTARAQALIGSWSFEDEAESSTLLQALPEVRKGVEPVEGKLGRGLRCSARGAHVDCGAGAAFDLRSGVAIEAWVLLDPPGVEEAPRGSTRTGSRGRRPPRGETVDGGASCVILEKRGSYALSVTRSGRLEGEIGSYVTRTVEPVVLAGRWTHVALRYYGEEVELEVNGVPRAARPPTVTLAPGASKARGGEAPRVLGPRRGAGGGAPPGAATAAATEGSTGATTSVAPPASAPPSGPSPPGSIPSSSSPLTLSAPDRPFQGVLDEVRLSGYSEPLVHSLPPETRILGWRKLLYFNASGHLDPAHHPGEVRIYVAEIEEEAPVPAGRTSVAIDYSVTFEEWLERWDTPPALRESTEEEKLLRAIPGERKATVVVSPLGVIR